MIIKEIQLEICRNLGNYENVRYSVTAGLNKGEEADFSALKEHIDKQHASLYGSQKNVQQMAEKAAITMKSNKQLLTLSHKDYAAITKRLSNGSVTLDVVTQFYDINQAVYDDWHNKGVIK